MTQEEKELLLKDLCERLPYGVQYKDAHGYKKTINIWSHEFHTALNTILYDGKPSLYLRPMSSMTEKEKDELWKAIDKDCDILMANLDAPIISIHKGRIYRGGLVRYEHEFLISHHFDHNGLIPKGLALPAPEGMYNNKQQ